MALDEPKDNEVVTEANGISVLIADDVKDYAARSVIDYSNKPWRQGFTIGLAGHAGC